MFLKCSNAYKLVFIIQLIFTIFIVICIFYKKKRCKNMSGGGLKYVKYKK